MPHTLPQWTRNVFLANLRLLFDFLLLFPVHKILRVKLNQHANIRLTEQKFVVLTALEAKSPFALNAFQ
jgi:hypothetical protein